MIHRGTASLNPCDVEAKHLLTFLNAKYAAEKEMESFKDEDGLPLAAEEEAHHLLHVLGYPKSQASRMTSASQIDRTLSLLHIDTSGRPKRDFRKVLTFHPNTMLNGVGSRERSLRKVRMFHPNKNPRNGVDGPQ